MLEHKTPKLKKLRHQNVLWYYLKKHLSKTFHYWAKCCKSVKCNLTKFEFSAFCRFQDIAVQSQHFPITSVLPFRQSCDRRLTFEKLA